MNSAHFFCHPKVANLDLQESWCFCIKMSRRRTSRTKFAKTEQTEEKLVEDENRTSENELSGGDWRDLKTAGQCLDQLCLSEQLSDISFTFKEDQNVKLPAHKLVLSMRSSVFEAMFYGPIAESGNTVLIEDIKPDTMKIVLRFIYSDSAELNGNNVLSCLYAAKKYCLQGLIEKCSAFLEDHIDADNVCEVHEQAIFYDIKSLQQKCFDFILENATDVFLSKSFLEISHDTLVSLLKSDELSEDEENIFSACVEWARNKCKLDNKDPSAETLRETLGDALYDIRFPAMSMEKFATVVTPSGILTSTDQITLYQYFATVGSSPLYNFTSQKRAGKVITLDVSKYTAKSYGNVVHEYCLMFRLANGLQPLNHGRTVVRVKSLTGIFVPEVRHVTHISNLGHENLEFFANGNKLTFHTPIHVTEKCCFMFTGDESQPDIPSFFHFNERFSVVRNRRKIVKGETIYITRIPNGLKSISFV
ncbi:BTB/POZ domain-containing protein 6-B-like [Mercenaria mercenaria]|uniref:BTB/POZ domain-containing protein 6-B-like n=1 Tax=Mercenaria mercenaria TaxID=6596 RepID=UPI00234EBFC6|nr:BTB/POZ domain-containing protein 6-B-like [Mercenaria mercenaria]